MRRWRVHRSGGRLLDEEVEQLVVEALRVGAGLDEVLQAVEARWEKLTRSAEVVRR
jgi:hypothetical protein